MKIPPVKYMRDFYPAEMSQRLAIEDAWRVASERAGFQPWDAPIVEHLDLYKRKSGDEIVGQLYTLTDRGDRELAIRPEMTPSLARMIAQKQAALPRPVKWYCIARMCRYERGQRGRLREFFQWNVDVLGVEEPIADAEVISVALDGMEALGLSPDDIEVRINSRSFLASFLSGVGIPEEKHTGVYAAIDKRGKAPDDVVATMLADLALPAGASESIAALFDCRSISDLKSMAQAKAVRGHEDSLETLGLLFRHLDALGKTPYCRFDAGIVRGLAYYTGPVFEIFDKRVKLRALCGGGRYDHLMETMGGQPMPAVGFGLGDVVLGELLGELKKLPAATTRVDYHAIPLEPDRFADALALVHQLRSRGHRADYAMKPGNLGKAMKRAADSGAKNVILVGGDEWSKGSVRIRNMQTGEETVVERADFLVK